VNEPTPPYGGLLVSSPHPPVQSSPRVALSGISYVVCDPLDFKFGPFPLRPFTFPLPSRRSPVALHASLGNPFPLFFLAHSQSPAMRQPVFSKFAEGLNRDQPISLDRFYFHTLFFFVFQPFSSSLPSVHDAADASPSRYGAFWYAADSFGCLLKVPVLSPAACLLCLLFLASQIPPCSLSCADFLTYFFFSCDISISALFFFSFFFSS